ncbi:DUF1311 domain-containing protein [Paracoccus subflavus]|uniref:DUF1311 domain-containing protein n=1 Tax=Paracoccus subflavus TaxID=2528244 RepID=A0A4Q9G5J0_9RHOB|nr:lysozyme inhibitor LprI family protein [Paracoccus subflavus]TBN43883.1 DUF1311 domain-containing protein [Paracoccus subflavus]
MRAALMILLVIAAPALAQDDKPLSVDASIVEACVADTPAGDLAPGCIGAAAKQCQQAPGGDTTIGISRCVMGEHAAWDAALNREYQAARAHYAEDQTAADRLRDAQRAWIAWRDAECAFQYARYGGGSMRTIAAANCQMSMTAMRALELRSLQG